VSRRERDLSPDRIALGSLSLLPASANNAANCNSLPFTQDPLASDGERQYAVWISGTRRSPLLSVRALPDGSWAAPRDLAALPGSAFAAPTRLDPHNSYALGVDTGGCLHVAGNHHNEPLRYMRSQPRDLDRWERGAMVGSEEESVTYPAFVSLPDGSLLFFYRDGRAGYGDVYLNRLGPGEEGWSRIGKLVEGRRSGESPYLNHVAVSAAGAVHVSGCFRGRGGAAANRDVWHALSEDGGASWCGAGGERLKLPLSHETVPIAIGTEPRGSGLVNQMGMDVDPRGRPHVSYFRYDEDGATQVALASHDGSGWRSRDLAPLRHRMETDAPIVDASVARPAIACTAEGEVWAVFRASHDGRGGRASLIRCTPDRPLRELPLYDGDLGSWEPTIDSRALRERGELHLLLTVAPPYGPQVALAPAAEWEQGAIGVLSVSAEELRACLPRSSPRARCA
jgi:hypothetical protein